MNKTFTFFVGLLGVILFTATSTIGGFLIEDYSVINQYISESYAIDTEYGWFLRIFGFIPSGILICLFCFIGKTYFPSNRGIPFGFVGIGIFYGLATVVVAIFPCDSGCNRELNDPSISQLIHNLIGALTYLLVPIFMLMIGIGLRKPSNSHPFSLASTVYGALAMLFVFLLLSYQNSEYLGLYQRMVELMFAIWVVSCAITIKNLKTVNSENNS